MFIFLYLEIVTSSVASGLINPLISSAFTLIIKAPCSSQVCFTHKSVPEGGKSVVS